MVILLKIAKVMNLHGVSLFLLSAIANLTKAERRGEMLPISQRVQRSLKKKLQQWPESISYPLVKGQNQPAVVHPATLSKLTLKPPFVSFVFRSLMLREAVTFN